ncbi:MAG TPA: hypothetical protein VH089_05220 [Streptosporangiaceae bacterium]|jgi:hypothetical protein|nr:hypothetical protein [Streptosporangiaceae bacterium]
MFAIFVFIAVVALVWGINKIGNWLPNTSAIIGGAVVAALVAFAVHAAVAAHSPPSYPSCVQLRTC